jgi:hypothetical protein
MSPEVLLCPECHERVDLDQHEYVVTNRDTARTRHNRLYAHFSCVRGQGKSVHDMSDMEVEAVHRRILSELDGGAMERLGIQRINKESDDQHDRAGR